MRAIARVSALAIGLSLVGCGASPTGTAMSVLQAGTQPGVAEQGPTRPQIPQPGAAQPEKKAPPQPAEAEEAKDAEAIEAARPMSKQSRMHIKRFFSFVEEKNPQAKDRLHKLEQDILKLNRAQLRAMKALRFGDLKDKTMAEVAKEFKDLVDNPDALIAKMGGYLDKVKGMSAAEVSQTVEGLPDIFQEMMKAFEGKSDMAGHEAEVAETPDIVITIVPVGPVQEVGAKAEATHEHEEEDKAEDKAGDKTEGKSEDKAGDKAEGKDDD